MMIGSHLLLCLTSHNLQIFYLFLHSFIFQVQARHVLGFVSEKKSRLSRYRQITHLKKVHVQKKSTTLMIPGTIS